MEEIWDTKILRNMSCSVPLALWRGGNSWGSCSTSQSCCLSHSRRVPSPIASKREAKTGRSPLDYSFFPTIYVISTAEGISEALNQCRKTRIDRLSSAKKTSRDVYWGSFKNKKQKRRFMSTMQPTLLLQDIEFEPPAILHVEAIDENGQRF